MLRHGETEWSAAGRHTGVTDIDLSPRGERAAAAAGPMVTRLLGGPPRHVLVSPRTRARRTAELAGLRIDGVLDDLAEWNYGTYEGLTTAEIRAMDPGWTVWTHPCPGGETAQQVGARADRALARARESAVHGDVLLVCHGHLGRVLAARWLGRPVADGVSLALQAAGAIVLGDERGAPQLKHVNVTPDLVTPDLVTPVPATA